MSGNKDYTAEIAHLERLLNTGLSGQSMIDGNMVTIQPDQIRRRLRELYALAGRGTRSGIMGFDLSSIGQREGM